MSTRFSVLAISGSTRKNSTNQRLLQFIVEHAPAFDWKFSAGIDTLPHFNPDLDKDPAPAAVANFRQQIREADAILICTPEYAMGVPGSLKNALDWMVSSASFSKKPVGLITASSVGALGHASLLETLAIIESKLDEKAQLLLPHIKARFDAEGHLKPETAELIKIFIGGFSAFVSESTVH